MTRRVAVALVLLAAACGDDDPAATTAPTTTTTNASSGQLADLVGEPPPVPPEPPPWAAAITADGRLVMVDTTTGAEVRELAAFDDPREPPPDGVAAATAVVDEVDVAPGGATVWFSVCCEPAGGNVFRVPAEGGDPERVGDGYDPTFGASARFVASVQIDGAAVVDVAGDAGRRWSHDGWAGQCQEVALSPDGDLLVVRVGSPGPGELVWMETRAMSAPDEVVAEAAVEPERVPGSSWMAPTFRRDGRLVVAESVDGRWAGRVLDLRTGEILLEQSIDYGGPFSDQDHDASGGWLLAVVAGDLRWWGPEGVTGGVDGAFTSAAW